MIIVISPSKTLDFETPAITQKHSQSDFLVDSAQLIDAAARSIHILRANADALDRPCEFAEFGAELAPDVLPVLAGLASAEAETVVSNVRTLTTILPVGETAVPQFAVKGEAKLECREIETGDVKWSEPAPAGVHYAPGDHCRVPGFGFGQLDRIRPGGTTQ